MTWKLRYFLNNLCGICIPAVMLFPLIVVVINWIDAHIFHLAVIGKIIECRHQQSKWAASLVFFAYPFEIFLAQKVNWRLYCNFLSWNNQWSIMISSSTENTLKPSFIHSGAASSRSVHWGLASRCALITISQCRPLPVWLRRRYHRRLFPLQYHYRSEINGTRGASTPTATWDDDLSSLIKSLASDMGSVNQPDFFRVCRIR